MFVVKFISCSGANFFSFPDVGGASFLHTNPIA